MGWTARMVHQANRVAGVQALSEFGAVVVMGITILYRRRRDRHHLVVMLLTSKRMEKEEKICSEPTRISENRKDKRH